MKVHVVMGATGEWSDRIEWPVRAYRSEEAARAEVLRLTNAAMEYVTARGDDIFGANDETERLTEAHRAQYDPGFSCDYTGTSYFIYDVELVDQ